MIPRQKSIKHLCTFSDNVVYVALQLMVFSRAPETEIGYRVAVKAVCQDKSVSFRFVTGQSTSGGQ